MAVTSAFTRVRNGVTVPIYDEVVTATFSGTYATGGFTWQPFAITGGPGSAPLPASAVYGVWFESPTGYNYVTSVAANGTATTKILSTANTELANSTAVPDATCTVIITKGR